MALSKVNPNFVSQNLGRRNLVINGDMTVAQRATSATGVGAANGYYALDRFGGIVSTTGRLTMSQSTDAPNGFSKSIKLDCTTADASPTAAEYFILQQVIEAQDIKSMARGTSGAKEVTVSFYVKGTAATYVCEMQDESSRELDKTFNVTTAWERVELTFPADTNVAAATTYDNTAGIYLYFWLQAGSNYKGGTIPTTWANQTNTDRTTGISNFFSSTSNELYITGVQMEVGDTATDFEHRSYDEELAACQRYYTQFDAPGAGSKFGSGWAASTTVGMLDLGLPVTMRTVPSVTITNCTIWDSAASYTPTAVIATGGPFPGSQGLQITSSSLTTYRPFSIRSNAAGVTITLSSEL